MSIGKGTETAKKLLGFIEEVESVRARKKQLAEAEGAIFAEAKAAGFDVKTIRKMIKLRAEDAAKRDEAQSLLDTYMHAIGMTSETPLFSAFGAAGVDMAARDEAVEFLKSIVPPNGEIVLKVGGKPIRVFRDDKGDAHAEEVGAADPVVAPAPKSSRPSRLEDFDDSHRPDPAAARIKSAADRAEEAARAKAAAAAPPAT